MQKSSGFFSYTKKMISLFFIFSLFISGCATENDKSKIVTQTQPTPLKTSSDSQLSQKNYRSNDGKGKSLGILIPESEGLSKELLYVPTLVQGYLVTNISKYSAISVLSRVDLDKVIAETLNPTYEDSEGIIRLGHIAQVGFIMTGKIIKNSIGYVLQINVTDTSNAQTVASYSGTCTVDQLDDQTAVKLATKELLTQMGVSLTSEAITDLGNPASKLNINGQTLLAQGITTEKQGGTIVEALSYYYQAMTFDPLLIEAENRASILSRNINSGNVREDARADIAWRNDWIAQLTETENYFDNFFKTYNQPYALIYSTDFKYGQIDYKTETMPISFTVNFREYANWTDIVIKLVQTMFDGLNKTGRKNIWELGNWPQKRVSNLNPFQNTNNDFIITVELVNSDEKIINRQNFTVRGSWTFDFSSGIKLSSSTSDQQTITFSGVNINDITDILTIRFSTINRRPVNSSENNNVLMITTREDYRDINGFDYYGFGIDGFNRNNIDRSGYNRLGFNGEGYNRAGYDRYGFTREEIDQFVCIDGKITSYNGPSNSTLRIPQFIKGITVTYISTGAFSRYYKENCKELIIPNSVIRIESGVFNRFNNLEKITIGGSVRLGRTDFKMNNLYSNTQTPSSAYSLPVDFEDYYINTSSRAGTYIGKKILFFTKWSYQR